MIRSYTQWLRVGELLRSGRIGQLRSVSGFFSYFNNDPSNIRNHVEYGGGALLDIGCYCIQAARFGFGQEPRRVVGLGRTRSAIQSRPPHLRASRLRRRPRCLHLWHSDRSLSTRAVLRNNRPHEIEIPFNAPKDRPTRIFIDETGELFGSGIKIEEFPIADQYTMQGDAFSRAVLEGGQVPVPLEEAIANMAVIEAIFRSGETGQWETPVQ